MPKCRIPWQALSCRARTVDGSGYPSEAFAFTFERAREQGRCPLQRHGPIRGSPSFVAGGRHEPQIIDETPIFPIAVLRLAKAQKVGRMDGDEHSRSIRTERQEFAARSLDRHRPSGKGTRGRRTERDDELGLDDRELSRNPPSANLDLSGIRSLVKAALAALLEFEMLHRVGDIDVRPFDSGFGERAVEDPPCRPDERTAIDIFHVTGLLAHEDE